ncbi:MAG: glycosyltransferase [Saprospiraceae bacterium]|nr:glycosyltransferase [Saprospiraceae bacterium]MBK6481389.1 glycosyltransferase [Saprospiraceae bacterium]MBK9931779.1 glycosyltransferase [Saprospiraceae bacterium]
MDNKLGITFCDFWPELNMEDNIFINCLRKITQVQIDHEHPDLVFYSYYGNGHFKYRCPKIFYTGENIRPDYDACDFSLSFDYPVSEKNYRFPLYALYGDVHQLCLPKDPQEILISKTKFCNFVVSNPQGKERNKFFNLLNKYKKVDSGGRFKNNIGHLVEDKNTFVRDYKFTLAFENSSFPGYTTEKIFQPMMMHSLPIYWGNPLVGRDFNTKSFINIHDFPDFHAAIDHIIDVDNNDDLYLQYLNEPYFLNNEPNEFVKEENLTAFLANIVKSLPILHAVSSYRSHRLLGQWHYYQRKTFELTDFTIRNIRRILNS